MSKYAQLKSLVTLILNVLIKRQLKPRKKTLFPTFAHLNHHPGKPRGGFGILELWQTEKHLPKIILQTNA
jgi:hypothetical protein